MKGKICVLVLLLGLLLMGCTSSEKRLQTALKDYVVKENKSYPQQLDINTSVDSCGYVEPNILRYYYTVSPSLEGFDTLQMSEQIKSKLVKHIKIDKGSRFFVENAVEFQYRYKTEKGARLFQIEITEKDYKK